MSHWNHRVVKHTEKSGDVWYGIHEVHYNEDNQVWAIAEEPEVVTSEKQWRKSFRRQLKWMLDCLRAPVIIEDDLVDVPERLIDAIKEADRGASYSSVDELVKAIDGKGSKT